jgi:hypothetical protein
LNLVDYSAWREAYVAEEDRLFRARYGHGAIGSAAGDTDSVTVANVADIAVSYVGEHRQTAKPGIRKLRRAK